MKARGWAAVFLAVSVAHGASTSSAERNVRFHQAPAFALKLKDPFSPGDSSAIQAGAALFKTACASCHGQNAMGSGNVPALAQGPAQSASDGEVFWFIGKGSIENGMPPSQLPERERWKIVTFVKSLESAPFSDETASSGETHSPPAHPPHPPFSDYRFEGPGVFHKILPRTSPVRHRKPPSATRR